MNRCSSHARQCPLNQVASEKGTPEGLKTDLQPVMEALFEPNGVSLNLGENCDERLANADPEFKVELKNLLKDQADDCLSSQAIEYLQCSMGDNEFLMWEFVEPLTRSEQNGNSTLFNGFLAARFKQPLQLNPNETEQLRYLKRVASKSF